MTAEQTTNLEEFDLFEVAQAMRDADVPDGFAAKALDFAHEYRGIKDLMLLWMDADGDADEQDEILADIQDMLNEVLDGPTKLQSWLDENSSYDKVLLQSWLDENSSYDEEAWPVIEEGLEDTKE